MRKVVKKVDQMLIAARGKVLQKKKNWEGSRKNLRTLHL